ncbi:unnamed protein product [Lepeophtheirus salmonis]|uniref:(salmon louse) hypothetical protein n=1 Tax=Lepeophtheirus salmonis TaxID=72036 RepID=A0A7R8CB18_LEPSM|nr:unnamed protein product [Lepeophtheirus salmonis]CAF2756578.1 unnamed protein product [Lepeophtheirus salmonis]
MEYLAKLCGLKTELDKELTNMSTMNLEYNHIKVEESVSLPNFSKYNFLDLLATVATETLKNDKSLLNVKTRPLRRPCKSYTYADVKKMPGSSLLRLFAIPQVDEMKKTYKFKCHLIPNECSNIVSSKKEGIFKRNYFIRFLRFKIEKMDSPLVTNGTYLKEHSYSLLSSFGKPPLNNDHDDEPQNPRPERKINYSGFLGQDIKSNSSHFMDVDGYVNPLPLVNEPKSAVPYVGREVMCSGFSEDAKNGEKSVTEKEKEAATMAIILLQLKGSKVFTAYSSLLSHLKSHTGIKAFECQDCSALFTRQHSLNYHRLIHDNQTRFTCEDCGRKFRHPSHYKEHRRRHTGELPFQCVDCLLRYKTRNTVVRLNGPTDNNDLELNEMSNTNVVKSNKRLKPPSDGDGGSDSSSSSITDDEEKLSTVQDDEPLPLTLTFKPVKDNKKEPPRSINSSSPVPNFVSDPPLGAITPKKKINTAMVSNGVTISKYSDILSSNIENKNMKSFRPSSKSAFKTPGDIYKRVRNNVEIRKLICFGPEYTKGVVPPPSSPTSSLSTPSKAHSNTSQTSKVKILQESVETNNKTSAILAEIDGKRVLLIPKNEQVVPTPVSSEKPKSKLEECLLYGVQRAKNSV